MSDVVPEVSEKLLTLQRPRVRADLERICQALRQDLVVLIAEVDPDAADEIVRGVADGFGLLRSLEIQAGYADIRGHRERAGEYYMSVNRRDDYQFIPPHSEGNSFTNLQLASFFSLENSTDGGATVLMHVNSDGGAWHLLREKIVRAWPEKGALTSRDLAKAKVLYSIDLRTSGVRSDDRILQARDSAIPGLQVVDALARPVKTRSRILDRELYGYWDSIGSIDFDSAEQYLELLRRDGLLKQPDTGHGIERLDNAWPRRVWHSGARYGQLFDFRITRKLARGELVIANNLTWTHAVSNWSPGSGRRGVVAAFA